MCPISGGNWGNGSNAGVWALNLNNVRGNSNNNVGFRADSALPRRQRCHGGAKGDAFRRAVAATCIGWRHGGELECFRHSGRARRVARIEGLTT